MIGLGLHVAGFVQFCRLPAMHVLEACEPSHDSTVEALRLPRVSGHAYNRPHDDFAIRVLQCHRCDSFSSVVRPIVLTSLGRVARVRKPTSLTQLF